MFLPSEQYDLAIYGFTLNFSTSLSGFVYYLRAPHSFNVFSTKFVIIIAVCTGCPKLDILTGILPEQKFILIHTSVQKSLSPSPHPYFSPIDPFLPFFLHRKKTKTQKQEQNAQKREYHFNQFQLKSDAKYHLYSLQLSDIPYLLYFCLFRP